MIRKLIRIGVPVIFVVAVFIGINFSQVDNIKDVINKARVSANNQTIVAKVVKDSRLREKGLSEKESIGINQGMLFIFEDSDYHTFWMKDMNFPIDIVWISGDEIVGINRNVQPEPGVPREELTIYTPPEQVDKVLEIKAGRSTIMDISEGTELSFDPLVPNALEIN